MEITALMKEESRSSLTVLQVNEKFKRIKKEGWLEDSCPKTQKLVWFHLEDFSDTMGDVIEGYNLNIGPSCAEAPPLGYALRELFLE